MPGFPHHSKWAGGLGGDNKGLWIWLVVVCAAAIILMALVGCSETPDPKTDLEGDDVVLDTTGWTVYANYDEFPNVAARCDGDTRMYTTTRTESALLVVPDHNLCQVDE